MNDKEKLSQILDLISSSIKKEYSNEVFTGVFLGLGGISLFQFYLSNFNQNNSDKEFAETILFEGFENISDKTTTDYASGISGLFWSTCFLKEHNFIDLNLDKLLNPLDSYLYSLMISSAKNCYHDFTNGSIGYGYYFLKRYSLTKSKKLKEKYKEYLTNLLNYIEEHSLKDNEKVKWLSIIDREKKNYAVNLSIPHGMLSILIFLSKLYLHKDFKDRVEPLIEGGTNFIKSLCKNFNETNFSVFPNYVSVDKSDKDNSRLAWCYGDLGVANTLWQISKNTENNNIKDLSLSIFYHSAKRRDLILNKVIDSGICHGAFGIALFFNRIYKETNEETFRETATYWINEGIKMSDNDINFAGFKQWYGESIGKKGTTSLLEGISGIGLCIIDQLDKNDYKWDECLMLC